MAARCVTATYETEREAICAYFALGFSHKSILTFLNQYHGIQMSLRSLRRRLSKWNLRRHNFINCSEDSLVEAIRQEVNTSGGDLGYRQMWCLLRVGRHIRVPRGKVSRHVNLNHESRREPKIVFVTAHNHSLYETNFIFSRTFSKCLSTNNGDLCIGYLLHYALTYVYGLLLYFPNLGL